MSKTSLVECSFSIPQRRDRNLSGGGILDIITWEWLQNEISNNFEGSAESPRLFQGFYRDPASKEMVQELSKRDMVALPGVALPMMRTVLLQACRQFQQKSIIRSAAGKVECIRNTNEKENSQTLRGKLIYLEGLNRK